MSEHFKPFDPAANFAEMQAFFNSWMMPWRTMAPGMPRFETLNPVVQEVAILAAMHNMASLLQNPGAIKEVLNRELAERSQKLTEQ